MANKIGFVLMAFLLVGAVFLFGCTQQTPKVNETINESAVNESTVLVINQTQDETPVNETKPVMPVETRKAGLDVGLSSSASSPIGKGLDAFTVVLGRIEIHGSGGWTVASDATATADLKTINSGRQQVSLTSAALGTYDRIRMNVINASSVYVTAATIPGVLSEKKATSLTIPSSIVELPFALNMTNESETYSVTVVFDINGVDPATVTSFNASQATVTVKTYSQCRSTCTTECERTDTTYKECIVSCGLDENRTCDINAADTCMVECICPNNRCLDTAGELCKVDCLNREKSSNSTCKMAINATCMDYCKAKPAFVSCTDSCMRTC